MPTNPISELVGRLRSHDVCAIDPEDLAATANLCDEAADTIERLERENAGIIEIVRKDLKAWQRAAKKHRKAGNELAEEMCVGGAQNVEQLLKSIEKFRSSLTPSIEGE